MNSALFSKSCLGSVIASDPSLLWFSWSWQKISRPNLNFKMKGTYYKTIPFYSNLIFLLLPFKFTWASEACVKFRHTRVHLRKTLLIVFKRNNAWCTSNHWLLKILLHTLNKTLTIHHRQNTKNSENKK